MHHTNENAASIQSIMLMDKYSLYCHLLARVCQLHHTLVSMLLLDGACLKAKLLRRDPHQLLGSPISLGQRVVHPTAVPVQVQVCVSHGGFRTEQQSIKTKVAFQRQLLCFLKSV